MQGHNVVVECYVTGFDRRILNQGGGRLPSPLQPWGAGGCSNSTENTHLGDFNGY